MVATRFLMESSTFCSREVTDLGVFGLLNRSATTALCRITTRIERAVHAAKPRPSSAFNQEHGQGRDWAGESITSRPLETGLGRQRQPWRWRTLVYEIRCLDP